VVLGMIDTSVTVAAEWISRAAIEESGRSD
jgi:hypothetical protein